MCVSMAEGVGCHHTDHYRWPTLISHCNLCESQHPTCQGAVRSVTGLLRPARSDHRRKGWDATFRREQGLLEALSPRRRGRKGGDELERELAKVRRENEHLQARLEQAEAIIEVQKKLSQLLGLATERNGVGRRA